MLPPTPDTSIKHDIHATEITSHYRETDSVYYIIIKCCMRDSGLLVPVNAPQDILEDSAHAVFLQQLVCCRLSKMALLIRRRC